MEKEKKFRFDFNDICLEDIKEQASEYQKLMTYYQCAIMEIETKFNVLNAEFSLAHDRNPISGIKSRLKSPGSIQEKMERLGLNISVESIEENLNDIAGVRVVCSFQEDVYVLARALLSQDDVTLIRKKDYIADPKPNGYRSLHLIVEIPIFLAHEKRTMKVEIQLRTIAMDFWATLEHQLRYKKNVNFTEKMQEELLQCALLSADLDFRMDSLRREVQDDVQEAQEGQEENRQEAQENQEVQDNQEVQEN